MEHQSNETLRKGLHIVFGLGAFALKWIPWPLAAAVAAAAVLGNWLILHRIVGRQVARHARGWDAGIVIYPAAVLALILVFRNHLAVAAIAWVILAFGDGAATIAGKRFGGPRIPWNRDKSWSGSAAFVIAGLAGAYAIAIWMVFPYSLAIVTAVVSAAVVESLALGVDDNLTVPAAAAVALAALAMHPFHPYSPPLASLWWLGANTVLALAGYLLRSVDLSGAVGGWILGTIILLGAGAPMYIALLTFFVIGTAATKLGYRRKAAAGLAQEKGGRRGFGHAFSNVGVATICAIAFSRWSRTHWPIDAAFIIYMMGIGSLATAAADTTASEIGQLLGRRTFLPLTFRKVPVGTEGAISVEGTVAGIVAGFVVALAGLAATQPMFGFSAKFVWLATVLCTVAAAAGSYVESVVGSWNRKTAQPVPNGVLNFFNTAVGATIVYVLARNI
jgi:uncharacterized protein (TIGR00297 family)